MNNKTIKVIIVSRGGTIDDILAPEEVSVSIHDWDNAESGECPICGIRLIANGEFDECPSCGMLDDIEYVFQDGEWKTISLSLDDTGKMIGEIPKNSPEGQT